MADILTRAGQGAGVARIPTRFPTNIADRLYYCMRRVSTGYYHLILSLDGHVDEGRLAKSARLAAEVEPLLGCRFVDQWFRPRWERQFELRELELLRVEEPADVPARLREFMSENCDPRYDLQFKLLLLRKGTDTICLRVNHMIADGRSGKDLIHLLASIYNRLGENPGYHPRPHLMRDRSFKSLSQQLTWKDKRAIVRNARWPIRRLKRSGLNWQFPIPSTDSGRIRMLTLALPRERGEAIRRYARHHQFSLNLVLITAFFRALAATVPHQDDVPLSIITTVDLRRYLQSKQTDTLCNMGGAEILFAPATMETPFHDIVAQFQEQFEGLKAKYLGFNVLALILLLLEGFPLVRPFSACIPFAFLKALINRVLRSPVRQGIAVLTNVGEVDQEICRFGDTEATHATLFATVPRRPGILGLAVIYFRNAITISCSHFENRMSQTIMQAVLDRMDHELPGDSDSGFTDGRGPTSRLTAL